VAIVTIQVVNQSQQDIFSIANALYYCILSNKKGISVNIIIICMKMIISGVGGDIIYSNKTRNTFLRNVNKLEDTSHS
jgi:hypothetical protein